MKKAGNTFIPDDDAYFAPYFAAHDVFEGGNLIAGLEHVKQIDCAVDGGAHVGSWTRHLAGIFHHVYAFEPQPDNYKCLEANTRHLPNVHIHRTALGERFRAFVGLSPGNNSGCWHISDGKGVCMMPLDELRPLEQRKVGYLKLDVEGYEYYALVGAKNLIERCSPVVQIEEKKLPHSYDCPTARSLLNGWGYREAAKSGRDVIFIR